MKRMMAAAFQTTSTTLLTRPRHHLPCLRRTMSISPTTPRRFLCTLSTPSSKSNGPRGAWDFRDSSEATPSSRRGSQRREQPQQREGYSRSSRASPSAGSFRRNGDFNRKGRPTAGDTALSRGASDNSSPSYRRNRNAPARRERQPARYDRRPTPLTFDNETDALLDNDIDNHNDTDNSYAYPHDENRPYSTAGRYTARPPRNTEGPPSFIRQALDAFDDDLLYGISPILLALESERRGRFERLFLQERSSSPSPSAGPSRKADNSEALTKIKHLAADKDIKVHFVPKGDLNLLSNNRPHQGVVLQAAKLPFTPLANPPPLDVEATGEEEGTRERPPCYLVLDEVSDPQNAGALMRSAYFLGATGVIVCSRNSSGLTPALSKASAGAVEVTGALAVSSMPRFLRRAREVGWRVVGLAGDAGGEGVGLEGVVLDRGTMVVVGSEGCGLRTLVRRACDVVVRIEGGGCGDAVDSLNVSVAGGIALYQLLGR